MIRMRMAEILGKILDAKIKEHEIFDDTNLIEDFGLSSLDILYLIVEIEDCFKINIDLTKFDSNSFYKYLIFENYIRKSMLSE